MFGFLKKKIDLVLNRVAIALYVRGENLYEKNRQYKLQNKYNIHNSFRFNGRGILFYGDGKISIAENSYIGSYSTVQADIGCSVKIGKEVQISHNVRIYTSTQNADDDFEFNRQKIFSNVIIEDYAWVGANVFINPGVRVGRNAVIGSNSVVTKDVAEFEIVGGVPAKHIRFKKSRPIA